MTLPTSDKNKQTDPNILEDQKMDSINEGSDSDGEHRSSPPLAADQQEIIQTPTFSGVFNASAMAV